LQRALPMLKADIVFRTDASIEIGTGHVTRCLALADQLSANGARSAFVSRSMPNNLRERIQRAGHALFELPIEIHGCDNLRHSPWLGTTMALDAAAAGPIIAQFQPNWLVVDHYALDARWERAVRPNGVKLMVIDDLADRQHECDVLLDQNLGHNAGAYKGLVPSSCYVMTGPHYALLRPEFAAVRAATLAERTGRGLRRLLITMGGVDLQDATSTVLQALKSAALPQGLIITVIMGRNAPALEKVRALGRNMPWPTEVLVDVDDMYAHMVAADLAISAGGGTTWERCCLGLPSIVVETADNQAGIAQSLTAIGAALDPGSLQSSEFPCMLRATLDQASGRLEAMAEAAAKTCDGDGTSRIVDKLCTPPVRFRAVQRNDSRRIWEWRRAMDATFNRSADNTNFFEHDQWFKEAIASPNRCFSIVTLGDLACGYLRLDLNDNTSGRVSICLAPDVRGRGIASQLLKEAVALGACLGLKRLDAEIHHKNVASRRLFERSGYAKGGCLNGFVNYTKTLEDVK
jgi:UDP-2,4-diacetamido-2,4,6-trideoxy-beta-L-altropyranose hydrolase